MVERGAVVCTGGSDSGKLVTDKTDTSYERRFGGALEQREHRTLGWRPGCECKPDDPGSVYTSIPCTVLDPFCGSGTTLLVACQHGREAIGIELSPEYAALAERRIGRGLRPGTYVDEQDSSQHPLFT